MSDMDKWKRFVEAKKRREVAIQKFKDEVRYRRLEQRPRCCATCVHGSIFEDVPTCYRGPDDFEVSLFGICDKYEED